MYTYLKNIIVERIPQIIFVARLSKGNDDVFNSSSSFGDIVNELFSFSPRHSLFT